MQRNCYEMQNFTASYHLCNIGAMQFWLLSRKMGKCVHQQYRNDRQEKTSAFIISCMLIYVNLNLLEVAVILACVGHVLERIQYFPKTSACRLITMFFTVVESVVRSCHGKAKSKKKRRTRTSSTTANENRPQFPLPNTHTPWGIQNFPDVSFQHRSMFEAMQSFAFIFEFVTACLF